MIHQYQNNGYNIVLDVNSGSVHVVDKIAYDVISCLEKQNPLHTTETLKAPETLEYLEEHLGEGAVKEKYKDTYPKQDLEDVLDAVIELTESGQLFTRDIYEDFIDVVKQRKTVVKALCLHIAHDCNLACRYCFAEEGEYHGRRALMSYEVGKKALDFLIANSGSRRNLEVDFFGGEPLMNWQVVKDLVAYGREQEKLHDKHFRFTLTTNGVLLNDEVQEFVNKEMDNVVLSLDGRKEVNDRMRPFRNGKGSYDLIVPKFQKLAESRNQEKYYIRGTFTRENLDFSNDVMHYVDLGFKQISIEPVVGEDTDPYAIRESDLPQIFEEYDKLAKMIIDYEKKGNGFNFFHFMIDLEGGPCVSKRLSGCGSGTEYLAVTPWGDLYPCHQFVGDEAFLMGNVDEGIVKPEIADEFRSCSVYSKEKCRSCFARFYCSGGCMANSYKFHNTIHDTYDVSCEMERKRVECAIMIKAALADEERDDSHEKK
ncbi:MAG: thioether cross-link-forming SCIFF peptide maturase [Oscillospiraceae bacterium]|nr:thioether cross-link-forming SCIFF peptide maturase [Oscillospiraceae bacterium]